MSLASASKKAEQSAFRVMVVDDSAVIRGLISRWLESDPEIEVVATAQNGAMALRNLETTRPEVVILDIEMPEMDGLTALPKIIEAAPHVQVIMASTLTRRNAEISLKALKAGAADYIPKPETSREVSSSAAFRQQILQKIKALGTVARCQDPVRAARARRAARGVAMPQPAPRALAARPIQLAKPSAATPRVLAIGASTGGPQALFEFFSGLKMTPAVPVVIAQHMPPTFTSILAEHLRRATGLECEEGREGERLAPGKIYIAPGDHHMIIEAKGDSVFIRINQDPPENFCRPAVDPLFRAVARVYGAAALGVVLTGMGSDGLKGSSAIVAAGGTILAQDEATSVVWGMPGAVSTAGLASAVLPLGEIGRAAAKIIGGRR